MKTGLQSQPLLDDGHQHVDGHRHPDLSFDGILAISVEGLDSQVLLDPFEKQFYLPARLVEQADGEGGQVEVVGEETEVAVLFRVVIMNAAERIRVVLPGGRRGQHDGVIGSKSGRDIDAVRVSPAESDTFLGASDKEGAAAVEDVETLEVDVGAIHHVERTGTPARWHRGC